MRTPKEVVGIGKRIQKVREEQSMEQEQLAHKAKIKYPTLFKLERGEIKNPSAATVADIARALGVDSNYLIGDKIIYKKQI